MINDEGYATYVLCNWGLRSKIKMGEKKATSLHRYADLIQGWGDSWWRRWALHRRDQLWNDQQWRAGERQWSSWKIQHFEEKNAKSNAVAILCHILNMQVMAGEETIFCDLRWNIVENLNPPRRKLIMNEEATTVQATQPPSSLPELIFRCFGIFSKLDLCI